MRSMSMLQLLGGVAVAGAVAAGTTAFTAGSTMNLGTGVTSTALYGATSIGVSGATLDGFTISTANADPTKIDKVTLILKDESDGAFGTPGNVDVQATLAQSGTAANLATCAHTTGSTWECVPSDNTKQWSAITAVNIVVADV